MFLFAKPPVLRWMAVALALGLAMYADLRPPSTISHPFSRQDMEAGTVVQLADLVSRPVPEGLFEPIEAAVIAGKSLTRSVAAGEPILASALEVGESVAPADWMIIELAVPSYAKPGDAALVVTIGDSQDGAEQNVRGMVITASVPDDFGETTGSVAVPPGVAPVVAQAAGRGEATVLVAVGGSVPRCSTPSCGG